jgi:hypothetical protein
MVNWKVGITTAKRDQSTIERTVASVIAAGWDDITIFADCDCLTDLGHPVTNRGFQVGAWGNFYLGLTELTMINPTAEYFLMCQDDVVFAKQVRQFCERHEQIIQTGIFSPYCNTSYSERRGKHQFHELDEGARLWGALAMVFCNRLAYQFLGSEIARNHRRHGINEGLRNVDTVVGIWCQRERVKYFVYVPSLVQHIGITSTLGNADSPNRSAADFVGEECDASRM